MRERGTRTIFAWEDWEQGERERLRERGKRKTAELFPEEGEGEGAEFAEHHAGAYGLTPVSARAIIAEAFTGDWALWKKWKASVDGLGDAGGADRVAELVEREMAVKR